MSTSPTQAPLVLERVIGCTSLHNAVFAVNPATGDVASAAGCVVTLFCPARNRTVRFVRVAQPVSALAFSADGQRLAIGTRAFTPAGQQTGRTGAGASLSLWSATQGYQLAEVPVAHSEGVAALTFSPDGQWLVSVGFARDRALHVWAVGHGALSSSPAAAAVPSLRKAASGRISQRVTAVSYAASGVYFVTAGERHLKFWSTEPLAVAAAPAAAASAPPSAFASTAADGAGAVAPAAVITLSSKPGVMSEAGPEFETFVDVACAPPAPTTSAGPVGSAGSGPSEGAASSSGSSTDTVYALTSAGMLCAFDGRERLMEHWVSLRVRSAFSLSVVTFPSGAAPGAAASGAGQTVSRLYAGCSDGIVRVFDPRSLAFLGVLPAPPAVGRANATVLDSTAALPGPMPGEVYPAALAVRAGPPLVHVSDDGSAAPVPASSGAGMKLPVSVIYGDRSLVVWDCAHLERVTKLRCLAAHAGPVWDLAFAPCTTATSSAASGCSLPPGTFATVAGDSTLRLWNLHPRATYSRKEAPVVAAAAAAAAAQRIADADASALTADHHHDDDDADDSDHQGGASANRPATGLRVPSSGAFSDGSQTQLALLQPPAVLHLLSPSVAAAATASSSRSLGASGHHGTSRSGGRSKAPLLPGARPRGVIMKEQLAVLYADAEPEAEAAILAPEADAEADALGVVPERGRAPIAAYRSGPGVCSLVAGAGVGAGAAGSLALHERPGGGIFAADSWPASAVINEPFNSELGPVLPHDRGLRCLAFSPDGSHVATGDRVGNVRVFTVDGSTDAAAIAGRTGAATSPSAALAAASAAAIGQCVFYEIAHDAELSTLAFAPSTRGLPVPSSLPVPGHAQTGSSSVAISASLSGGSAGSSTGSRLFASGSRDTLVHIFDARCSGSAGVGASTGGSGEAPSSSSFSVAMSLPEHADGVTAVRFSNDDARLITTSSDGAVVFWKVAPAPAPAPALTALHGADATTGTATAAASPTTAVTVTRLKATKNPAGGVYDAAVDATNKSVLAVGAGDGIAVWSLKTGRVIRTLRASDAAEQAHAHVHSHGQGQGQGQGQVSFLTRVAMDPAGLFVAAGASDCSVRLLDFFSGAALARASGHAGLITGVAFAPDCRRLLTASLDGCIFVWRLSPLLTRAVIDRLREMGRSMGLGLGMGTGAGLGAATGLLASGPPSCVPQSLASLASPSLGSAATPAAAATAFPASGSSGSWPQPSPLAAAGASSSGVASGSDLALTPTTAALVQAACWGVGGGGGGAGAAVAPTQTASASATGSATTATTAAADAVIDARRPGGAALPPRLPSASALVGAGGGGGAGLGIAAPKQGAGSMHSSGASSSHADDQEASSTPRPTVAAWGAGVGGGSTTSGGGSAGPGGAAVSTRTTSEGLVQGRGHGQGDAGDQQHGVPAVHVPLPLPSSALSPPPVKITGSPAGSGSDTDAAAAGDVPFEFRESILPAWVRQQQSSWETATATAGAEAAATAGAPRPLPFSPPAAVPSTGGGGGGRSKWAVMMSQSVSNLLPATTATAAAAIAVGGDGGGLGGPIAAAPPVPPPSSASARRLAPHAEADADDDHLRHDDGDGDADADGEVELFPPPSGGATLHFHPPPEPVAGALGLGLGAGVGIAAPQEVFTVVSPSRRLPAGAGSTGATDAASGAAAVPALNRALESDDHDADADGAADTATAAAGAGGPGSTTSGFSVGSAGSPFPFASPPGPGSSFGDSPVPSSGPGSAGAAGGSAAGIGIGGGSGGAAMRQSVSVNFMRRSAALSLGPAPTAVSAGAVGAGSAAAPGHAAAVPPPAPTGLPSGAKSGAAAASVPPSTASAAASGLPASRLGASVAAKLQRMSMSAGSAGSAGGGVSRQGSGAGAPAPAGPPHAATTTGIAEASPPRRASTAASLAAAGAQSPQFTDLAAAAGQAGGHGHGAGNAAAAAAGNRYLASPAGASTPERTGSAVGTGARAGTGTSAAGLDSSAVSLGDVGVSALLDSTAQAASSSAVGTPARTGTGLGRSPPASASAPIRAPEMVASPQLGLGSRGSVAAGEEDAYINASFDSEPGQERSSVDSLSETAQLQHLLESARRATSAEAVSTAALMQRAAAPRSAAAEAEAALRALQAAADQLVRLLGAPTPSGPSAAAPMPPEAATALRRAAADIGRRLLDAAKP